MLCLPLTCSTKAYKQKMPRKVPEGDNLSSLVRARSSTPPPPHGKSEEG